MTRRKGIAVFLLAVFLLSLAAGCSSSGGSEGTAAPEATEAATQAPGTAAPTEGTETAAPTEEAGTYPGLPIVEETATITYWYEMHPLIVGRIDGLKDNITWQYLEEITNVHVEFIDVVENSAERFNIMCASGDIADVMISGRDFYPGGSAKGIEDGIFLELTDVIENYMPNYKAAREADEEVYRDTMLSDGSIGDIFQIYRHAENPTTGPIVRLDWLEELGIDPESIITYDDYHDMLLAFKTEMGPTTPCC